MTPDSASMSSFENTLLLATVLIVTLLVTTSFAKSTLLATYYKILVKSPIVLRLFRGSKYYVEDMNYEIAPLKGVKKGLKKVDNMYLPTLIKNISLVKSMTIREDDTFVSGYPRSGKRVKKITI